MTVLKTQDDPQIRLQTELDSVANRLHTEFDPALGPDAVTRQLAEVMGHFHDARILTYVPVLTERETRSALRLQQSSLS